MALARANVLLLILVLLCCMLLYLTLSKDCVSYAHLTKLQKRWFGQSTDNHSVALSSAPMVQRHKSKVYEDCHRHPQLCWLREVLSRIYNQTFPTDIYNLSTLYKYKTHMFLDYPGFFGARMTPYVDGPELRRRGEKMMKTMDLERLLTGNTLKIVSLPKVRKCDYNPHREYQYKFKAQYNMGNIDIFVAEILLTTDESWRRNDIFGVIKTDRTVSACELVDYFRNHTYHIACPILENKFQISIKAMYHSISPLLFSCKKNNLKELKVYTHDDFHYTQPQLTLKTSANVKCTNGTDHDKGFWLKTVPGAPQSAYHWATSRCHFSFIIPRPSLKCLREKKVLMFGDSHMNRRQDSIAKTYGLKNFEYYVSTSHSVHLLRNLLLTYQAFLSGSKHADIIIVNVGAHDFVELDIVTFIATMSDIFTMFKKFQDLPKPPRIIWVEIYPTPFIGRCFRYMTKLVVESTNDWVNHNMQKLGIEVVHSFDIATTMANHVKDDIHYWDSFGPNMIPPGGKTSVGGAVISVLFNMICPNAEINK